MTGRAKSASPLIEGYRPLPGVADELFDTGGAMRPVWAPFVAALARLSPDEIAERFARGDRYLRDAGVYFRQYSTDAPGERDWPLSHIPVILPEAEWRTICDGLAQRAELLERVMADLYGPARLVSEGHLPAELVAQSHHWLRPLVGVRPASDHHLHLLAFEIGRSPDGSWFVLGDRAQAPSGAGFALENRMATARVFSDPFPRGNMLRLAGFFREFRAAMDTLPRVAGRRTAILTPGPGNDTYFEHTFIARYLGLMLLEGEDLTVRNGEVLVRTVEGLVPVGALWRRLDSEFADPLELAGQSRIGTPGLVEALRAGSLNMVNALGSGVLEIRALMAFLPKIAQVLLGEPLTLPNIATWWCGAGAERAYIKANTDRMMIGNALSTDLPFDTGATTALGGAFRGSAMASVAEWIDAEGPALVGQEAVTLSTTPAWSDGRLVPRPMAIRVMAARTPQGWTFMPGGYARIGRTEDATALTMQKGGSVADVWILADAPVPHDSLLPPGSALREAPGVLPARAADNLFWLGRYVERFEGAVRLVRAYHLRRAENGGWEHAQSDRLAEFLDGWDCDVAKPVPEALGQILASARICAGKVRDRFSVDGWAALADLSTTLETFENKVGPGDDAARAMGILLRKITGFAGLVHENMYRFAGWRFLSFGRALERADGLAAVLAVFAPDDAGGPELAVEFGDSVMTHQRRYRTDPNRETVMDLLALDPGNPRSIAFQLDAMCDHASGLPRAGDRRGMSPVLRRLLPLRAAIEVARPDEMNADRLWEVRTELDALASTLSQTYLG